jgi:hypothetical protein
VSKALDILSRSTSSLAIYFLSIALLFTACGAEPKEDPQTVPSHDSISEKDSSQQVVAVAAEEKFDYTGTYELRQDRYNSYIQHHIMELKQQNDSIKGSFSYGVYKAGKKTKPLFEGYILGKMDQTASNVNSGTTLYLYITKNDIDSSLLKTDKDLEFSVRAFGYEPAVLMTHFSKEKNTIEHNYAGGEWDTWTRLK